jgi:hypothetical protein
MHFCVHVFLIFFDIFFLNCSGDDTLRHSGTALDGPAPLSGRFRRSYRSVPDRNLRRELVRGTDIRIRGVQKSDAQFPKLEIFDYPKLFWQRLRMLLALQSDGGTGHAQRLPSTDTTHALRPKPLRPSAPGAEPHIILSVLVRAVERLRCSSDLASHTTHVALEK